MRQEAEMFHRRFESNDKETKIENTPSAACTLMQIGENRC